MNRHFVWSASSDDAHRIAAIYNQGIRDRIATFETALRTDEDIAAWFDNGYPVFVAGRDHTVMAFAVAFPYRDRPCYEGVREFSVYVAREARGLGYGRAAMDALLAEAESSGWWKMVSRVFPENVGSRKLLAGLGFREVGLYEKHARLDGAWRDVLIVEKLLV